MLDFQFSNLLPVPIDAADTARLKRGSAKLQNLLEKNALFVVVSTDPVRGGLVRSADLRSCSVCAADFARRLGADVAITSEVQKVSNLILNLNV